MAHGSISFVRTCRVPMVSTLAAAISDVGLDAADHRLDYEHYPHLRQLALAHTWTSVGAASWLGNAAGIWMRGNGRCNYRFAPDHTTGSAAMRNRRIGVKVDCARRGYFVYLCTFPRHL